jgi:molybdopterin-guanine dinucleotide biosynthesis protein B
LRALGFAGFSGSGKTTLIEAVIPLLRARGLAVSLIKHAHHGFDVDLPGKDSWRHRQAGAQEVLVTSGVRWALMHELRGRAEPTLAEHLERLSPCDVVLVEGYKREPFAKIEVRRRGHEAPPLAPLDPWIIAIAADFPVTGGALPCLDLNDPAALVEFIAEWLLQACSATEPPEAGGC